MDFVTKNAVEIEIQVASFQVAMKLKQVVAEAIKESGTDLSSIDIKNLGTSITPIVQMLLTVDTSDKVNDALFKCLERCKYKLPMMVAAERITKETFESVEMRKDYYEIAFHCIKENLAPFFLTLFSQLNSLPSGKNQVTSQK
jgi:hypothetical protein